MRVREARMALRGHTAELLAKAVSSDALDLPLTKDDKAKLLAFIALDGGLDAELRYVNRGSGGYREWPGAADRAGEPSDPLDLLPLVRAGYGTFVGPEREINQQLTMFQPVGGIDALPHAFAARLGERIRYGAEVREIRKTERGVRVAYFSPAFADHPHRRGDLTDVTGDRARTFGDLTPAGREALALREGAKVHPQYPAEFASSISVAWQKIPYNRGAWVAWTDSTRRNEYPLLCRPDGPIYLAGEHMSYINAWQAGALESARYVARAIHARARAA